MDYQKQSVHSQDILSAAEAKGEAKGKAEGASNKAIEIARAMLAKKKPIEEIEEFTGLSKGEIEKL